MEFFLNVTLVKKKNRTGLCNVGYVHTDIFFFCIIRVKDWKKNIPLNAALIFICSAFYLLILSVLNPFIVLPVNKKKDRLNKE